MLISERLLTVTARQWKRAAHVFGSNTFAIFNKEKVGHFHRCLNPLIS